MTDPEPLPERTNPDPQLDKAFKDLKRIIEEGE